MSGKGGGGGDSTTVQAPWSGQQPYLTRGFEAADSLLRNPAEPYTGTGVAPQSTLTTEAINMAANQARGPLTDFASNLRGGTESALNVDVAGNPQYQALSDDITSRANENLFEGILPRINESAAGMGAFGGSDQQLLQSRAIEDTQDSVSSALAGLGGQFYSTDVGARSSALATAPGIMSTLTAPTAQLSAAGQTVDARRQAELTDAIGTFNRVQQAPENALDRYISRTRGNVGSTTTSDVEGPSTASRAITGAAGGGLVGLGAADTFGLEGPWGWYGAALGGILGML